MGSKWISWNRWLWPWGTTWSGIWPPSLLQGGREVFGLPTESSAWLSNPQRLPAFKLLAMSSCVSMAYTLHHWRRAGVCRTSSTSILIICTLLIGVFFPWTLSKLLHHPSQLKGWVCIDLLNCFRSVSEMMGF